MIKKYRFLEENEGENKVEKEYILHHYLKKIIKYLKECEVMEVFSNHVEAFDMMFHNISYFITKANRMRPERMLTYYEGEEPLYKSRSNPNENYIFEMVKKKKILKVGDLLLDKIRN